ncbi:MAG: hypothetical protein N3F03_00820 [Ignavibacteria bacterium]|nr:hypothetical protein [Ignavibacteria bacterium]
MVRKRAMNPEKASLVKIRGHQDARDFAEELGIGKEFKSEPQAKKDIIDSNGYSYSVKSGEKKWQIFLYGRKRFETDFTFRGMDGLGNLFLNCIDIFPEDRQKYLMDKNKYKRKLSSVMVQIKNKLENKDLLEAFLDKSLFNSGEVNFFVIKHDNVFHVFLNKEVVNILSKNIAVENSLARNQYQIDAQKVVFKVEGKTIGEIEMRNDSDIHYRELKFWLDKKLTFNLLTSKISNKKQLKPRLILYGLAIKKLEKHLKKIS